MEAAWCLRQGGCSPARSLCVARPQCGGGSVQEMAEMLNGYCTGKRRRWCRVPRARMGDGISVEWEAQENGRLGWHRATGGN